MDMKRAAAAIGGFMLAIFAAGTNDQDGQPGLFSLSVAVPQSGLIILAVMTGSIPSEVQNLAMGMSMRRYIRPTNAFSKNRAHPLIGQFRCFASCPRLVAVVVFGIVWLVSLLLAGCIVVTPIFGWEDSKMSYYERLPYDSEGQAEESSPNTPEGSSPNTPA